jgi:branched-chain amino acid transport system permease protein
MAVTSDLKGSRGVRAGWTAWLRDPKNQRWIVVGLLLFSVFYSTVFTDLRNTSGIGDVMRALPLPSVNNIIVMCYYAILALGLNIVVGFAGLLDLGYVAFYVFGAYTTAVLASPLFNIHVPWWFVAPIAVVVAATAGVLLGAPTLRLRGDYLAIVTLGFGEILPRLARNLDSVNVDIGFSIPSRILGFQLFASDLVLLPQTRLIGPDTNITGGNIGVNPIDPPVLPIPGPWGEKLIFYNGNPTWSFFLILALMLLVFFVCVRLRDGRLGRAWMAIREDELAAASMGIDTVSTKLLAFGLGASFSGFTGAFFGSYSTAIFPESFNFNISITILIMIILGGIGSLRGVVLGAFILIFVNDTFLPYLGGFIDAPIRSVGSAISGLPIIGELLRTFTLTSYNYLLYGLVLVGFMIFRPEGLLPFAARKAELHGEGVSSDETFGTSSEIAEAATEFEEQADEGGLAGLELGSEEPEEPEPPEPPKPPEAPA